MRSINGPLVFTNGRLVNSRSVEEGQLVVENGIITAVGPNVSRPRGAEVIDVGGLYILPGVIDAHVHLRDFNHSHREELETATRAAAVGGITTVIDMPNSDPGIVTVEAFEQRCAKAEQVSYADYGLYAWAAMESLEAMEGLHRAGAMGFKVFMAESNLTVSHITRDLVSFARITEMGASLDALIAVHAENDALIKECEARCKAQIPPDLHAYLRSRPPMVEEIAIYDALAIARWASARIHICHLSSAGSAEVVAAAKRKSTRVTCEVCQSHLFLNVDDGTPLMGLAKFSPPLRTSGDQIGLWEGLRSGVIDQVASDHAPQVVEDKIGFDNIWKVRAGAPWLEIGVPMMFDAARRGDLAVTDIVKVMCEQPARNLRLYPQKGCLKPGSDADIVVIDPSAEVTVDAANFQSKGKYSPVDGRSYMGRPVMTFVRGQLVAREGQVVGVPGVGRRLRPLSS